MLALASTAHAGFGDAETLTVVGAVIAAIFWRFLIKIGLALLAVGILVAIVTVVIAIATGLHAIFR